jgi:hypothetical protein
MKVTILYNESPTATLIGEINLGVDFRDYFFRDALLRPRLSFPVEIIPKYTLF